MNVRCRTGQNKARPGPERTGDSCAASFLVSTLTQCPVCPCPAPIGCAASWRGSWRGGAGLPQLGRRRGRCQRGAGRSPGELRGCCPPAPAQHSTAGYSMGIGRRQHEHNTAEAQHCRDECQWPSPMERDYGKPRAGAKPLETADKSGDGCL